MTTEIKTMSLQNFVSNFVSTFDSGFSDFDTKEEDVADLIKTQPKEMKARFEKFASTFCENKNRMNKGTYEFISFDGNNFTYSITK